MRNTISAILLLFATQSDAGCGKLCDFRWWETATETALLAELAVDDVVMGRTEFGNTALHYAARYGSPKHIKILLEAGANVNAFNLSGSTPLIAASESTKNVEVLLEGGADIHAQNRLGDTALFYASYAEDPINVKKLLKAGADVNWRNNANWTPLHYAARIGHPSVVKALLNAGANVDSRSKNGVTPLLNWADKFNYPQTLNLLLDAGANVNATDVLDNTVLHLVLRLYNKSDSELEETILILLNYDADVLKLNDEGKTPWDYAQSEPLKGTQAYWALNDARYNQMSD
jgi:ankyrin repeat protein